MNWQERAENAEESLRSLASYVGAGGYNADTVDAEVFERKIRWGIRQFMDRLEKAEAELARMAQQEPVAWMREDGNLYLAWQKDLCLPEVRFSPLYAGPVPAVAAGLPAIGPYRDFIPAPAELDAPMDIHDLAYELGGTDSGEYHLDPEALDKIIAAVLEMAAAPVPANQPLCGVLAVPANLVDTLAGIALKCTDCYTTDAIDALLQSSQAALAVTEEWREVMTELADDLAIEIDQSYPPERRAYPSEQRRYEGEMAIVNRARALLQSEVRHD